MRELAGGRAGDGGGRDVERAAARVADGERPYGRSGADGDRAEQVRDGQRAEGRGRQDRRARDDTGGRHDHRCGADAVGVDCVAEAQLLHVPERVDTVDAARRSTVTLPSAFW